MKYWIIIIIIFIICIIILAFWSRNVEFMALITKKPNPNI